MATIFVMKLLLFLSTTMASFHLVNGQIGMAQVIALLRDVNGTSANMSATLPQLATLLRNQADMQMVNNLLLKNNTAKMESTLPQIRSFLQEQLQRQDLMIDIQRDYNANSLNLLQSHQNTLDQIVNTFTNTTISDTQIAETQTQMFKTLTETATTQTHMAATQSQMSNTLTQIANSQTQMAVTQT